MIALTAAVALNRELPFSYLMVGPCRHSPSNGRRETYLNRVEVNEGGKINRYEVFAVLRYAEAQDSSMRFRLRIQD